MTHAAKPQDQYDVIIIGSGVAGLLAALKIAGFARVCLLAKDELSSTNTWLAQGGIAAALGQDDSPQQHLEDTLTAGAGLCRREAVEILVKEGPGRIKELLQMGMPFDQSDGKLELGREGAHRRRRVVHAGGDSTGRLLAETLIKKVQSNDNITVLEHSFVTELWAQEGRIQGVELLGGKRISAGAVIIASGGCSAVYVRTTNNPATTGDGIAMAYRAGTDIADTEFVQFHPTVFHDENSNEPFLVSEAVRGEGAVLRDRSGRRFMDNFCEQAELGPRDVVARAIAEQMERTKCHFVWLDISHRGKEFLQQRFPTIYNMALKHGYDMSRQGLPVSPAAHYTMGGIKTGLWGETNIEGLYTCGEAACSGVHGANRLASNSLLEGLVFGDRTARHIENCLQVPLLNHSSLQHSSCSSTKTSLTAEQEAALIKKLKEIMLNKTGITRSENDLAEAKEFFKQNAPPDSWIPQYRSGWELKNMFLAARLIVENSLARTESRGSHFRKDYPQANPSWLASIVQSKSKVRKEPLQGQTEPGRTSDKKNLTHF